jgi:hypothetical protein
MTKNIATLICMLLTGATASLQAQEGWSNPLKPAPPAAPPTNQNFKTGDAVDGQFGGTWYPCAVFKPIWYSPTGPCQAQSASCSIIRAYIITCTGASGPQESTVALTDIRARAATSEDKKVATETAAALARQPRGNSVGAKYGTRDPRTCPNRAAPAHGAPSAEQVRQYVICELEHGDGRYPMLLVTDVKVQIASVPRPQNQLINLNISADYDPREPVWDIRGSFTGYSCASLGSLIAGNDFAHTHNCDVSDYPSTAGYCYKNTFGDWHCNVSGAATNTRRYVLPPEAN